MWSAPISTPHFFDIWDTLQLQPFRPGFQFRLVQAAIQHPAIHDLSAGSAGAQPGRCLTQTAAAGGGEENDGFSGEVIGLQEGVEDGSCLLYTSSAAPVSCGIPSFTE